MPRAEGLQGFAPSITFCRGAPHHQVHGHPFGHGCLARQGLLEEEGGLLGDGADVLVDGGELLAHLGEVVVAHQAHVPGDAEAQVLEGRLGPQGHLVGSGEEGGEAEPPFPGPSDRPVGGEGVKVSVQHKLWPEGNPLSLQGPAVAH
jgi:hypothetical protein